MEGGNLEAYEYFQPAQDKEEEGKRRYCWAALGTRG